MAGNSQRRGARRSAGSKKGATVGSGGQRRRGLEGKGPTPAAKDRPGHPAARRAKSADRDQKPRGRQSRKAAAEFSFYLAIPTLIGAGVYSVWKDRALLSAEQRARIQEEERRVVRAFALTIEAVEPGLSGVALDKAVAMVLFGMMNWTFTWLRPEGTLSYEALARVVARVFVRGIAGLATEAVQAPAGGSEAALPRGVCERS